MPSVHSSSTVKGRWLKLMLVIVLGTGGILPGTFDLTRSTQAEAAEPVQTFETEAIPRQYQEGSYDQYLAQHQAAPRPDTPIVIEGESFTSTDKMNPQIVEGIPGLSGQAVETGEEGSLTWSFQVPQAGLYQIAVRYYQLEGKNADIDRELHIDGELPFNESKNVMFRRIWANEGEMQQDDRGNDLYQKQIEKPLWQETYVQSPDGRHTAPYSYYFSQGEHTLTLISARERMLIDRITLKQSDEVPDYAQVSAGYAELGHTPSSNVLLKIQGEEAVLKSSQVLYPLMDRSDPGTEPTHISQIRLNTIGGYNWSEAGQWLTWNIEVPEDGLYHIGIKAKQNFQRGMTSYRKLYIDGKLPFAEMENIAFPFSTDWEMKELSTEPSGSSPAEPYLFYLTKGSHELKMEVTLGEMADLLRIVESSVLELNRMYRHIIMITGTVPDEYRDYQLDKKLPDLVGTMQDQADILEAVARQAERLAGSGDRTASLTRLIVQLRDMAKSPETIARRLETFKSNTSSLGDWIYSINYMPLSIDYLIVASPDMKLPTAKASFWSKLKYNTGTFMLSFFTDFNVLGAAKDTDKKITLWMTQGIDQAKIAKRLIDESFTNETGVAVDIQVVSEGVLLQAMLAGRGPDVAFSLPNDKPVNYALRNAVEDLSKYPGYEQVAGRFHPSAMVPYQFNGGIYGLPIDQSFPVLFYRKDILEEMNLEVPETWEDVFTMIPELQKHNLLFGFPIQVLVRLGANVQDASSLPVNAAFGTMLYQNGGQLYREEGQASALDTELAIKTFMDWTDLYTTYKLPITTDFVNRFRSGEMPIAIDDYTRFNIISVTAPELKGLWDFTVVPGTEQADGTVRRDVPTRGSAAVMLEASKYKDEAWAFLKWWTSTETQAKYSLELEGLFGPSGRGSTANLEAMARIPWQSQHYKTLMEQWKWARGIPEVAGGYFTGRHLDNAFRSVVISSEDPREAIDTYTQYINDEITKKRKEFGLPN
ncbi:extracellular solute-binding protein [Paenibacillus aceti]|uniref:ABC transporter substrate-binding protein n=1 Tax=Paenibacillus aceti TaxID=1820010 RepID=A0ABQ1W8C0_9BACL|nr:extracellular solute-binding protein [Paenibacillus aceti]GGG18530.1 ABC transporter substrate-binding protein [Paenibacillus aceti]